ncbi:MAG: hypothetical protein JWM74_256, partial [Myxococcaceae bacterium]|nr:hypothetical protein [Myxococcaceae bacterium]
VAGVILLSCQTPKTSTDAPAPSDASPAASARAAADAGPPSDAGEEAVHAAGDAGALDLLAPALRADLTQCASEAVRARLGHQGVFRLEVTVIIDGSGVARVEVIDGGKQTSPPPGSCFDRFGQRVAAELPQARSQRDHVVVVGPAGGWRVTRA